MKVTLIALFLQAIVLLQIAENVQGENILFFHVMGTASHRTTIWPVAEQLAEKGHNVTYIFPLKKRIGSHPKVEEILPSNMVPILSEFLGDFDINYRLNDTVNEWTAQAFSVSLDLCGAFYDSPEVIEWLSRPNLHYDLVLIDTSMGECAFGLVHKFQAKHILFAPAFVPYLWDGLGIVPESSSVPALLTFASKPSEMNFFDRVKATIVPLIWRLGYLDFVQKLEPYLQTKLNMTDMPPLVEFERNTSLVMANLNFVEDYPLSLPPLIVPISGLWCSKKKLNATKPLPKKLSQFIEGSDGFIYMSLGSAVDSSTMPMELLDQFLKAFGAHPHLKIFWRWTGPILENAPKNILFDNWFPQPDVLGHPKIKGFITQAGRPSSQEGLCHGVPLITIPIFGDQDYNADRLEYIGAAINLNINELTADKLQHSIQELTETDRYSKRMKQLSAMFKDRPIDPLDNAIYWTEYVLRHDTKLLTPLGIHNTWWQRRLLDVYAFLLGVVITLGGLFALTGYFALKYVYKRLVRDNTIKRKVE